MSGQEVIGEGFQDQVRQVEAKVDQVRSQIEAANEKVIEVVRERPFLAVAGAFAVGYAIGKLAAYRWFV